MLRRSAKTMITTAGIVGVLGVGVAIAADQPTCPNGNTPNVTQTQTGMQPQLRKRDGTGARHATRAQQRGSQGQGRHQGSGNGARNGSGNPTCPNRS